MNILDSYLQQFIKRITKKSINDYKMSLDKQIKNIDNYINYLREKRLQLKKLIDTLTLSLENKYIDLVNNQAIYCAEEIHDIDMIKSQLNDAESYYARIEADINLQSRMKITTEEAFHFIYHMSAVA